jgi:hypothetical protein
MSRIQITTSNICGTEKGSVQLQTGSVNIIQGTSFSGKSSLMRGTHLGLVGSPIKHLDEIERLHLNDAKSARAILRRGASEGSVKISHEGGTIEATIGSNGRIKGKGSNEKSVYTSMLSDLPKTRLYSAVINGDNGDDFRWVSEVVSEAKDLLVWQSVLKPLDQEIISIRTKFEQWKASKGDASSQTEEIDGKISTFRKKLDILRKEQGVMEDSNRRKLATAEGQLDHHTTEYNTLGWAVKKIESENASHLRRISAAEGSAKIANRRHHEAEELEEMELIEPDVDALDAAVNKATAAYDAVKGDAPASTQRLIDVWLQEKIAGPKLTEALESELEKLGDESKVGAAVEKLKEAKKNKDGAIRKFMEARSKRASASQMAAAARSDIKSAAKAIAEARQLMGKTAQKLPKMIEDRDKSKRLYENSRAEVDQLKAGAGSSPEIEDLENKIEELEIQKDGLEGSSAFEIRLSSLQMMPNEGIPLTEELGVQLLGEGTGGNILKSLVNSNLANISVPVIRSLIKAGIDNGILADIGVTSKWVTENIENQLQQTRKIFNEVGTTLFEKMPNSRIKSVELDTNYKILQTWDDGRITGLSGSGGELALTAVAILIAMRMAFTPDIPILMIDGVLESLDSGAKRTLLDFLKGYAKSDGVTIMVSHLDENTPKVKIYAH